MRTLDLGAGLRLLAFGAHADDIEIGCGGTLLRLLGEARVDHVDWVVMTTDDVRAAEAVASAAAYAASPSAASIDVFFPDPDVFGELRDGYLPYPGSHAKSVFEHLEATRPAPDLILVPCRGDAHQDHRLLAKLAMSTFRDHAIWEYEIPKYDGDLRTPNLYVPLDRATCERRIELLAEHFPSQAGRSWFTPETFWALLRLRGVECNAPSGFAEGFHARKVVV
jgi:LmbE family N-acetylglucosaminyl deacetylase